MAQNSVGYARNALLACTALASASLAVTPALAQSAEDEDDGLGVIIVTAQKREQSLQDVPISVTAITSDALEANRVQNVIDLSSLAPGMSVYASAGGSGIPVFSVRGQLSYGVAAGSDKQTSVYLDGVYIASPRGSIFDLPDVERIEILRGPQGTLFGRNATTGAVSIMTSDPTGEASVKASATIGNNDHWRWRLSAHTPQIGPFSAYFSYVHEQRDGDIKNLAPPMTWNRLASNYAPIAKIDKSVKTLGAKDVDTWFAALKFESGDFSAVYKYDRGDALNTPEAVSLVTLNRSVPLLGAFLGALVDSNGVADVDDDGKRPKGVHNGWSIPTVQKHQGHSLTANYVASDNLSFKSIVGYRKSSIFATSPLDGMSALPFTQQAIVPYATFVSASGLSRASGFSTLAPGAQGALIATAIAGASPAALGATLDAIYASRFGGTAPLFSTLSPALAATLNALATRPTGPAFGQAAAAGAQVGQPFVGIVSGAQSRSEQWSAELQANYDSDFLTATVGAMWFKSKDHVAEHWLKNTTSFSFIPNGVIGQSDIGEYYNTARSIAAYAQLEFHLNDKLDVVVGGRITNDKKYGSFRFGLTPASLAFTESDYDDTRFNYLIGVNYKLNPDVLLYAKYSTAYVSGGTSASLPFEPETVKSAEAGIKAEFLNNRVRTNLTAWWADVKHLQSPSSVQTAPETFREICARTSNPACNGDFVSVFVLDVGGKESWGLEFEAMARPFDGMTIGGNAAYTKVTVNSVPPAIIAAFNGNYNGRLNTPKWTGSVFAQYETQPLIGDAYLTLRTDAVFRDTVKADTNPDAAIFKIAPDALYTESYWIVNGRVALKDINLGGVKAEVAAWARNLFDTQRFSYALNISNIFIGGNYIPARSYGLDVNVSF
jgi:iron complex outermembrane receptor protein